MRGRTGFGPLRALASLRRFRRAAKGSISVEFALFSAFVLAPMALVGYDFGSLGLALANANSAARAGAQAGMREQDSAINYALVEQAAKDDAGDPTLNVTAIRECRCPTGTPGVWDSHTCETPCPDGGYDQWHLLVTVESQVKTLISYPGMPNPYTVRARMTVRAR